MSTFLDNLAYTKKFIRNYEDKNDTPEFIDKRIMWGVISCQLRYKISEQFILKFKDKLNFVELSTRSNFSTQLLEHPELRKYWNVRNIILHSKIIPDFAIHEVSSKWYLRDREVLFNINKFLPIDKLDKLISSDNSLIDWEVISEREDLTKYFIEKYLTNLNLDSLLEFSNFKKLYKKDEDYILVIESLNELT